MSDVAGATKEIQGHAVGCSRLATGVYAPVIDGREVQGAAGIVRHFTAEEASRHAEAIFKQYGPEGHRKKERQP